MLKAKRLSLAICAALTLAAGSAHAIGDIQVANGGAQLIHPYFKTSCWSPEFSSAGGGEWVFFGAIGAGHTFTWDNFKVLLDPKCRNPIVKFTYALPGEPAPQGIELFRTVHIRYDAAENVRIELANLVYLKDVSKY